MAKTPTAARGSGYTDNEILDIYERNKTIVYRVCFAYMKNPNDTEDAVQETFLRFIKAAPALQGAEHEKAWLLRTASNLCKNRLRHWWRRRENIEAHEMVSDTQEIEINEVLECVLRLPKKYKTVVYLYYYEGYDSAEIARMLRKAPSTVRNHLHEARNILRKELGGDWE